MILYELKLLNNECSAVFFVYVMDDSQTMDARISSLLFIIEAGGLNLEVHISFHGGGCETEH